MSPHFGSKVTGHEAYENAVRNEAGGGNVFGVRVRGAITGSGPVNDAKRQSEFGASVVQYAEASDEKGTTGDTVSIESLKNILAENPTFLDSLYEAELAREDGARPEALGIFYEVERGIKGQMRADVMAEIRGLLGQKGIDAEAQANAIRVRSEALAGQAQRTEENKLIDDAGRVKALRERNDNVKAVQEQQKSGEIGVQIGLTTEQQESAIATKRGVTMPGQESATGTGTVATKPGGDVHVETQSTGNRLGVPKGTEGSTEGASSQDGTSPVDGAVSLDTLDSVTKADLEAFLGEDAEKVKGTGANGAIVKDDLVKAAKKKLKAQA